MRKEEEQRALLSCTAQPARYHSLKFSPGEKKRRQQPEQDTPELCTGLTLPQPVQRVLSHHQAALSQRYSPSLQQPCSWLLELPIPPQSRGDGSHQGLGPRSVTQDPEHLSWKLDVFI